MAMSRGVILILLALLALLSGCKSLPSRSVERITRDTVYIHNQRLDSVYVYQDRLIDRTQDTLQVKETRVEYRYRMLRDTIHHFHRDSIPYEVIVYRERPLRSTVRSGLVTLALLFIIYLFIVCKRRSS